MPAGSLDLDCLLEQALDIDELEFGFQRDLDRIGVVEVFERAQAARYRTDFRLAFEKEQSHD
ncbi:hypothetical protein [Methylosinus sp. PW1]|uniref:hypothetical protein n=1 Tax=Methylosinus sp. PW1 TaxID=107636 RepID=UPI000562B880|nr:hypothetical protein [Methylosinus sp. PW1]